MSSSNKICLVATELVHAGLDLPAIVWGVFFGLPYHAWQFRPWMQLRERVGRVYGELGRIDVFLREKSVFEKSIVGIQKKEERRKFLLREKRVPLHFPFYTPLSLRFWLAMGIICGYRDVRERISKELQMSNCPLPYIQDLHDAVADLLLKRVIIQGEEGKLLPTHTTQDWIYSFIHMKNTRLYEVQVKDEVVTTLEELRMLKHHLKGQSLALDGKSLVVEEIDTEDQIITAVDSLPDLQTSYNKLRKYIYRKERIAHDKEKGFALLIVTVHYIIDKIDARTRRVIKPKAFETMNDYLAVFHGVDTPLDKEEKQILIRNFQERFVKDLTIDPVNYEVNILEKDNLFGPGLVFIDKSSQGFAWMMYNYLSSQKDDKKKGVVPEKKYALKETRKKSRFYYDFLEKYTTVVTFIADFHIDGSPFLYKGEEIDCKEFCKRMVDAVKDASWIVFLGDTFDKKHVKDEEKAWEQLWTLLEILDEYGVLWKTVIVLGNHDPQPEIYCWKKPVRRVREGAMEISLLRRLYFVHGHDYSLEEEFHKMGKDDTEEKKTKRMVNVRKKLSRRVIDDCGRKPQEQDPIVFAHSHDGFMNEQELLLCVPSIKKFFQKKHSGGLGWLGLVGFGLEDDSGACELAIDNLEF